MHRERERGEGRASFLITLALFGAAIFVAIRVVPVRVDAYQFREALREEARYASVHKDDQAIVSRLLDKAASMEIPLNPKNLAIRRSETEVVISARYEKSIDLKVTTYLYKFEAQERTPTF